MLTVKLLDTVLVIVLSLVATSTPVTTAGKYSFVSVLSHQLEDANRFEDRPNIEHRSAPSLVLPLDWSVISVTKV